MLDEILEFKIEIEQCFESNDYIDRDLKRILMKTGDFMDKPAKEFMMKNPKTIQKHDLIAKALKIMEGKITSLIIKNDKNEPVGLLHIHDILKSGVY